MSNAKELFLRNRELSNQWRAIANSDAFDEATVFALCAMAESNAGSELTKGANQVIAILRSIANVEPEPEPIKSGLDHDLSVPDRSKPKPEEKTS